MKRLLYWAPRVLAIVYILFLSMFALDVFDGPQWYIGLFIHLIPSFILTFLTVISWKHERFGGILFIAISTFMVFFFHSIAIAAPVFVVGVLFLVGRYVFPSLSA